MQVTGDATPAASTHSPSSTLLTAQRLDTMPASQRTNLTDAIVTLAPGMIRGHDDFVHVRGHEIALNPSINGVSFWENPHAVFSPGLSPEVIDTANVMTGGFSAEYGNRFGGVVDIVTKSGLVMGNSGSLAVSGGAGRPATSVRRGRRASRRLRLLPVRIGVRIRSLSEPAGSEAIHDSARGGRVFAQLDATLGRAGSLRVVADG